MQTIQALIQVFATADYSSDFLLLVGGLIGALVLFLVAEVFGGISL